MALVLSATALAALAVAASAQAAGQSFTFLAPGFTQSLYGVDPSFLGGVAFAPNGDPLVNHCAFSGSPLDRFDSTSTSPPINGTSTLHPFSTETSNAGCGLTNHPNGALYSNTSAGVVKLDANTGAQIAGAFGPGGNALGIAVDPQTGDLAYVESDGTIGSVDPALTTSRTFSTVTTGSFIDQIAFDPTGNFLFLSDRSLNGIDVLRRDGTLARSVPQTVGNEPDGIAFHSTAPQFVLTNNNDGTLTRFDFPGNDYTQVPTQSLFASGGFRGDNLSVGSDGCAYLTQDGVRYDDGTTAGGNSLVQICPGFAPPPGVGHRADLSLTKAASPNPVIAGQQLTYTLTASNAGPDTAVGATIVDTLPAGTTFQGASPGCTFDPATGPAGTVTCPVGDIPSGGSASVTIVVLASAGSATNTAAVSSRTADPDHSNNTATNVTRVTPASTVTTTGTVNHSIIVPAGQYLALDNAQVNGSVIVHSGGALTVTHSTIGGSVVSDGAVFVTLCGSTFNGPVDIKNTSLLVRVGDDDSDCAPNRINGTLSVKSNNGGVEVYGNTTGGPVTVSGNHGASPLADGTPEVEGNHIGGSLACSGNIPPPTNDGQVNTASGAKLGQCAGL